MLKTARLFFGNLKSGSGRAGTKAENQPLNLR